MKSARPGYLFEFPSQLFRGDNQELTIQHDGLIASDTSCEGSNMAVEQMNISMPPKMAKFVRGKVKTGGYTSASEVVRTAVRRMQEAESREARQARSLSDDLLNALTPDETASIEARARAGFAAIERGEYTEYVGREGLADLAAGVKSRGRRLLAERSRKE